VQLAVAFGASTSGAPSLTLLVDCKDNAIPMVRRLASGLAQRLGQRLDVFRLSDARPAAILMRQALEEGLVLKDENDIWPQLQSERDEIFSQAEEHERWTERLHSTVREVIEADGNVKLAVEFGPIGSDPERDDQPDMNLLLGCDDEAEDVVMSIHARLQETGFDIGVMPMVRARGFPYALSHIVRTGRPLKDENGEWDRLQSERDKIVRAGTEQHRTVQTAKKLYGGPGGTSSLN
jgi:hypothetical protein